MANFNAIIEKQIPQLVKKYTDKFKDRDEVNKDLLSDFIKWEITGRKSALDIALNEEITRQLGEA